MRPISLVIFVVLFILGCNPADKVDTAAKAVRDLSSDNKERHRRIREQIRQVQVGMDKQQVQSLMGEPKDIRTVKDKSQTLEVWTFDYPVAASQPPMCMFDMSTGKVVKVISGEE